MTNKSNLEKQIRNAVLTSIMGLGVLGLGACSGDNNRTAYDMLMCQNIGSDGKGVNVYDVSNDGQPDLMLEFERDEDFIGNFIQAREGVYDEYVVESRQLLPKYYADKYVTVDQTPNPNLIDLRYKECLEANN